MPRIQGGAVDAGCYESDLNVGIPSTGTNALSGYYDAASRSLILQDRTLGEVDLFDAQGRWVSRYRATGRPLVIGVPAGIYVMRAPDGRVLRFLVP